MVGRPLLANFKAMVQMGLIKNCPVTLEHGKTVQKTPKLVVTDNIDVPSELMEIHKDVTLAVDI
eukprot:11654191-Ditylum_brightwellii.AAC.1